MIKMLKNKLKEQKGLTLIELLAVIVILGIIAAIAVPSILGLIDNSKKDAHVANAQQMISSAKMAIASEATYQTGTKYITLDEMTDKNYIEKVENPDGGAYVEGTTLTADSATVSNVKIVDGKVLQVVLVGEGTSGRKIVVTSTTPVSTKDITRDKVVNK